MTLATAARIRPGVSLGAVALLALTGLLSVASAQVTCVTPDGGQYVIPADRINDDYCDCPFTGIDEPGTSACSGGQQWPGSREDTADEEESPVVFACPQQPDLKLAMSKVNDGICDCCDGADEATNQNVKCPDDCEAVLAEARRKRQLLQDTFTTGAKKRQEDLQEYANFVRESKASLVTKEAELVAVQKSVDENDAALTTTKIQWIKSRLEIYANRVKATLDPKESSSSSSFPDLGDLLHPLTTAELQNLVVHACQMAGEMPEASKHKTCVPLRLAGLSAGVMWEPSTYKLVKMTSDDSSMVSLADVVHANTENPPDAKWHQNQLTKSGGKRKNRRRLDEIYDDYMDDFEDYRGDYGLDDDDFDADYKANKESSASQEEEGDSSQRDAQTKWVKEQPFSVPRVRFLAATEALLQKIEEVIKQTEQPEDRADDQNAESSDQNKEGPDPMKIPLLRSQIQRSRDAIHKGFTYAVSARVLLQDMEDRDLLTSLLFGVWHYGQLSSWQMWQVYQSVVPELGGKVEDTQTCRIVWGCPPIAATRKIGREHVMMPPAFFVQVVDEYCRAAAEKEIDPAVCSANNESIPESITDGIYGYYSTVPRESDDSAAVMFEGLALDEASDDTNALEELIAARDDLESHRSDLEDEISGIKDKLGEEEDGSSKYGHDGELYTLKDTCLEITAGKYVYELCLFKSSKQKEGNSSGGTDLGRWTGSSVSEEGQRIWAWENGAKCWNGPKRSAWAYLTCGATTRIISADEPETCKYVFEVESHIACDENYRILHQLS